MRRGDSWEGWVLLGLVAVLVYTGRSTVGTIEEVVMSAVESVINLLSEGIATAEGFFVPGSRPARNHNPGDLTRDITGTGVGTDGAFIKYDNDEDGWFALKHQVALMFSGSQTYRPDMTIREVSEHYVPVPPNTPEAQESWRNTVAQNVGVDVDTRLIDIASLLGL